MSSTSQTELRAIADRLQTAIEGSKCDRKSLRQSLEHLIALSDELDHTLYGIAKSVHERIQSSKAAELRSNVGELINCLHLLNADAQQPNLDVLEQSQEEATMEPQPSTEAAGTERLFEHIPEEYEVMADLDFYQEFVAEVSEHLQAIEENSLKARKGTNKEMISALFRGAHTIKGTSAFFQLLDIHVTAHYLESILEEVRAGKRLVDESLIDVMLQFIDLQRLLLDEALVAIKETRPLKRSPHSVQFLELVSRYLSGVHEVSVPTEDVVPSEMNAATTSAVSENVTRKTRDAFVRVQTNRLDGMMDSIGEMTIYSTMLIRRCREVGMGDEEMMALTQQVERISRDLQDIGMSMRLMPIRGLFHKVKRVIVDTSRKLQKDIEVELIGEDTEVDRSIIELLADPLLHMVRNAVDHGIEDVETRRSRGKASAGRIRIRAEHTRGVVLVTLQDDGGGLPIEKIRRKAIERELISEDADLPDAEIAQFIFHPGFSTASSVTELSGRGVGMDVVKSNIESLRGRIDIHSVPGEGTTFSLELPLTLALIDGIEIRVGSQRFVIPTLAVTEFVKPREDQLKSFLGKGEVLQLREESIPVFRLSKLLQTAHASESRCELLALVDIPGKRFGIGIDEMLGTCRTMIKSIDRSFTEARGLSGCAVLADGAIGLILDVHGLYDLAIERESH